MYIFMTFAPALTTSRILRPSKSAVTEFSGKPQRLKLRSPTRWRRYPSRSPTSLPRRRTILSARKLRRQSLPRPLLRKSSYSHNLLKDDTGEAERTFKPPTFRPRDCTDNLLRRGCAILLLPSRLIHSLRATVTPTTSATDD